MATEKKHLQNLSDSLRVIEHKANEADYRSTDILDEVGEMLTFRKNEDQGFFRPTVWLDFMERLEDDIHEARNALDDLESEVEEFKKHMKRASGVYV